MGNRIFRSSGLLASSPEEVESKVSRFLERTEWDGNEPVLIVAWEDTDLSPSTQFWIPPSGHGPPRLDGIYEQILEGERCVFIGSRPSTLPPEVQERIGEAARTVAAGLQALGYVGRCSFDFIVAGNPNDEYRLRFTECNGRWGGTSIPMALMDRLFPNGRPPYRAQDVEAPALCGLSFPEVLHGVGDETFDTRTGNGRFIFYNVGPLRDHGKLDVIALGDSLSAADRAMEEILPRRLGIS